MTTITQENLARQCEVYRLPTEQGRSFARALGITITPAEPPAEMVKLAEDFARKAWMSAQGDPGRAAKISSLLTLQHAVDVVKDAVPPRCAGTNMVEVDQLFAILTALGAGGRDAG
jgi:hypothetical protein